MILKWYIKFLDKVLPSFIYCPALFQIVLEFRNELVSKIPGYLSLDGMTDEEIQEELDANEYPWY